MPSPPDLFQTDVGHRVLQSIRRIIRRVSSHSRRMSTQTGLTVPQLLCMQAIEASDAEEVTLAYVADAVHLSRSTASGVIERLVRAGLVDRVRGTIDRRRVHLTVTDAGRKCLAQRPAALQESFLARLEALPAEEQEQLLGALERVVALMDAEDLDAAPLLVPGEAVGP